MQVFPEAQRGLTNDSECPSPNNRLERDAAQSAAPLSRVVCAGHGARLPGWKSPDQVYVEPEGRRARFSSFAPMYIPKSEKRQIGGLMTERWSQALRAVCGCRSIPPLCVSGEGDRCP